MARETGPQRHQRHLETARRANKVLKQHGFRAQPMRKCAGGCIGQMITEPKPTLRVRGKKQRVTCR